MEYACYWLEHEMKSAMRKKKKTIDRMNWEKKVAIDITKYSIVTALFFSFPLILNRDWNVRQWLGAHLRYREHITASILVVQSWPEMEKREKMNGKKGEKNIETAKAQ